MVSELQQVTVKSYYLKRSRWAPYPYYNPDLPRSWKKEFECVFIGTAEGIATVCAWQDTDILRYKFGKVKPFDASQLTPYQAHSSKRPLREQGYYQLSCK